MQPPFQAISGLEVLYGGLGSLWRLPLQLSSLNDTLFGSYLAAHPLTAGQNRTLAKPRPPTPPGFGEHPTMCKLRVCTRIAPDVALTLEGLPARSYKCMHQADAWTL